MSTIITDQPRQVQQLVSGWVEYVMPGNDDPNMFLAIDWRRGVIALDYHF